MRFERKRRREALTDYRKRVEMLKGGLPRVVVRKSNRRILMQLVEYKEDGDAILASASSDELRKEGWEPRSNTPTAYLTGMLLAKRAKKLAEKGCVLDIGIYRPIKGAVIFAAAKGSKDAGLNLRFNGEVDAGRVSGAHIAKYAAAKPKGQFAGYAKANFDATRIAEAFEAAKKKILSD